MDLTNLDEDGNSGGITSPYLQSQKVSTFVTESSFKLEVVIICLSLTTAHKVYMPYLAPSSCNTFS